MKKKRIQLNSSKAEEPLVVYFSSLEFLNSFREVTMSSIYNQDNERREFTVALTYLQRMELLYELNCRAFAEFINQETVSKDTDINIVIK